MIYLNNPCRTRFPCFPFECCQCKDEFTLTSIQSNTYTNISLIRYLHTQIRSSLFLFLPQFSNQSNTKFPTLSHTSLYFTHFLFPKRFTHPHLTHQINKTFLLHFPSQLKIKMALSRLSSSSSTIKSNLTKPISTIFTLNRSISSDTTLSIETSIPFTAHNCTPPSTTVTTTPNELLNFFHTMALMRRMEIAADSLYKSKLIRGFCHLYDGQEAVAVGMEGS